MRLAKRPCLARTKGTGLQRRILCAVVGHRQTHVGERVERGDVIGYVGTTGASTGCHLHFMAFEDGETVDPMGWL